MKNEKHIWNLEVGDIVTYNSDVWFITKLTKTQYTAQKFGSDGKGRFDFIRITIRSGQVIGERSWARMLEGTPEEFYAAVQAKLDEKKAIADERKAAWDKKVDLVGKANSDIIVTDEAIGGLKKAAMVNSKGEPIIVFFTAREEQMWLDYNKPPVTGFRIDCSTWSKDWGDRYRFSGAQASGITIEEALIELVAGHYWN